MASKKQSDLKRFWQKKGYLVVNIIRCSVNGMPDLMALKNKEVVFIESKEKGDSVKPLQVFRMQQLSDQGFCCYVNKQKFQDWLKGQK